MSPNPRPKEPLEKALALNLNPARYGTFAEIGAGQEVVRLFKNELKIFVYPLRDTESGELITTGTLNVGEDQEGLYRFLVARGQIEAIRDYREDILHIFSKDVLSLIRAGDSAWEEMVPDRVVGIIRSRGLFGFNKAV